MVNAIWPHREASEAMDLKLNHRESITQINSRQGERDTLEQGF